MWRFFVAAVLAALMTGCGSDERKPVPRRKAYARVELPDTAMRAADDTPLHMPVNASARTECPRPGWLDISYPTLGATVHVTFTKAAGIEELERVKANRMQRLMLNAGEEESESGEFSNGHGFNIYIMKSEGVATPIQFLATDDSAWVVSGAAYFNIKPGPGAVDSLRPMVDAVERDILKSMGDLCHK